ncbi:MAG: GxxExxY protein [Planctomycetes bacterium]|nr:GxxExxY protein [Planctomycetota bacterium]
MTDLIYQDEAYAVIGATIEVHRELGPGFLEAAYQEAMSIELTDRNIPHIPQPKLHIHYKGRVLEKYYVADFICYDCIAVELKAEKHLTPVDEAQLFNQLKATKMRVGALINFGAVGKLEWKRFVN